jgi:hypothetical protein
MPVVALFDVRNVPPIQRAQPSAMDWWSRKIEGLPRVRKGWVLKDATEGSNGC